MLLKGKLGKVGSNPSSLPIEQVFLASVKIAIEEQNKKRKPPSKFYSPSAMNCMRQMYYKRIGVIPDEEDTPYSNVSMADTGTRRHEAIQEALEFMTKDSQSRFCYVDVSEYVKRKQSHGKCLDLVILGKQGAETMLLHKRLGINFRCDGIIVDKQEKKFYLFEFKNQISFKASGKQTVDKQHLSQVITYCALLDLNDAFVVYENRDTCELYCPQTLHVSEYDKQTLIGRVNQCESFVVNKQVPTPDYNIVSASDCNYCRYKSTCRKDGR